MAQDEVAQRLLYDFKRRFPDLAKSRSAADIELSARRLAAQIQHAGEQVSEGEFTDLVARDLRSGGFYTAGGAHGSSTDFGNKEGSSFIEELKQVQRESGLF